MRSRYADYFNHDTDAPDYDVDVQNEGNPIRTGYAELMAYVGSCVPPGSHVLDLGTGTGNTILQLPLDAEVTGIDISRNMLDIAQSKLGDRHVTFIQDDLLDYVTEQSLDRYDVIVSTYAFHHLIPTERERLFVEVGRKARSNVRMIVGDLMYQNGSDKSRIITKFRHSYPGLSEDFEDEFFWDVETSEKMLKRIGWEVKWNRFSDLSWVGDFHRVRTGQL